MLAEHASIPARRACAGAPTTCTGMCAPAWRSSISRTGWRCCGQRALAARAYRPDARPEAAVDRRARLRDHPGLPRAHEERGVTPADIRGLDDLPKLPAHHQEHLAHARRGAARHRHPRERARERHHRRHHRRADEAGARPRGHDLRLRPARVRLGRPDAGQALGAALRRLDGLRRPPLQQSEELVRRQDVPVGVRARPAQRRRVRRHIRKGRCALPGRLRVGLLPAGALRRDRGAVASHKGGVPDR